MSNRTDRFIGAQKKTVFLKKLEEVVEANLQNDQFSVEALAEQMNMSRSNLHRKLKQSSGQTANQFIREYRLERAMDLLKKDDRPVSEVAYEVGFSSPSYFTSCFTEYYSYPPGEAKFRVDEEYSTPNPQKRDDSNRIKLSLKLSAIGGLLVLGLLIVFSLVEWQTISTENIVAQNTGNQSVAVIPFKSLNVDQEYKYFSEGVVEAINRHLSQLGDLKVISLMSTNRYRKTDKSVQQIGKELQVNNLLEGSIQRQGNTVRVEVHLTNTSNGQQIWAENYDRELKDILDIQSEIAENVASALKSTLSPEEKVELNQQPTTNSEAYELYLKGTYENNTYTRTGNDLAKEYFQQAIQLDSGFALAHTGLALTYIAQASMFGSELSAIEGLALAKPLLDKALALEPDLVEARTWKAFYLLYNNWDFEGAEQEYKKAIVTNNSHALAVYSDFLNFTRRHDEALVIARRLDAVDPYYLNSRMILALYYTKQYEEAIAFAESRIKIFNNYFTLDNYGFLLLNTGNYPKAIELFQQVMQIEDIRYPRILGWMGAAYAHSGQREKALELIDELSEKLTTNDAGSIRVFVAVIYAALNNKEAAIEWLQQAYEQHEMEMPWLMSEPQFYVLHAEPQFQKMVEGMGFP